VGLETGRSSDAEIAAHDGADVSGPPVTGSLHAQRSTPVHGLDATVKLVCLVGLLLAVVVTPPTALWAFAVYAALVGAAVVSARLPVRVLGRRMLLAAPFVVFALALPFLGAEPHRDVLGVAVSIPGAWAAWSILAKATLGTAAAVVLAWSTPASDVLAGLERLRVPRVLCVIAGFMVRYLDLVAGELHRLQVARVSRGDDPRWLWQGRAVATTAGTLFVRSFERGERVHHAMIARGFTGSFPPGPGRDRRLQWFPALVWPATAWVVAAAALWR
jgi:cobalt/nickel transport system permease protein